MRYEIEIASPISSATRVVYDAEQAPTVLDEFPGWHFCLVAAVTDQVDHGNFIVWRAGEFASIKLHEHREHTAKARSKRQTAPVVFKDSDNSEFVVSGPEVVLLADAFQALKHWLKSGEKDSALDWS